MNEDKIFCSICNDLVPETYSSEDDSSKTKKHFEQHSEKEILFHILGFMQSIENEISELRRG